MTPEQKKQAAQQVLQIISDTIRDCPDGAPLGPMYMALTARGMSIETFQQIISTMEQIGLIKVSNHCAYWIAGRLQ